jgi:hypothetical protein
LFLFIYIVSNFEKVLFSLLFSGSHFLLKCHICHTSPYAAPLHTTHSNKNTHRTHSSKPSNPHNPTPFIPPTFSPSLLTSPMITSPFTVPSPGKLSHHSPAPGKPPFLITATTTMTILVATIRTTILAVGMTTTTMATMPPPSHPP